MEYLGVEKEINGIIPIVSVCVPAYQHESFIAQCLDSILSQKTDFPFEILIGEDDSQDRTREICKEYADRFPDKIRLFMRDGTHKMILYGKRSGRLNHLALYGSARGKYVCICDGDDYWMDDSKLQVQYETMEKNPQASLCMTNTFIQGEKEQKPADFFKEYKVFKPKDLVKTIYMGHISSWMMRNHMAELLKSPITNKAVSLDNVVFNFYKMKGETIYLPRVTSVYRFNPNGIYRGLDSKTNHKRHFMHNWYLFRYLHKDPFQLIRSMTYASKRYFKLFVWGEVKKQNN